MKQVKLLILIFLISTGTKLIADESKIYIDVGQAQIKRSLLALPPLLYVGTQATNKTHITTGQDLYRVIYNDLNVTGLFTFIQPDAYLEDPNKVGLRPAPGTPNGFNYNNWKTIGTEFLIRASYQIIGSDLTVEAYVYHIPTTKLVLGRTYRGTSNASRRMAHTFANDLMQALTGKQGMFLTKIVASRQNKTGSKEIVVMDWDGANAQQISRHNSIAISPAWSPDGDKIAYTAFAMHKKEKRRNTDLFVYDLGTGKRFLVSYRKGINSGAAFLPDGLNLLLTLSQLGSPDIFKMSVDGKNLVQLTRGPNRSMNVEPAVSPDGKQIAFSSDRLGRPMIFIMNADGGHVRRLTFAGKYNSTPAWSPDGKTIAFAALDAIHFDIFTVSASGSGLKRLTSARKKNGRGANNESPSWSPDGRHILFSSDRTGEHQLYIINPDGTNERRITTDSFNWEKPKWSPYLK